MSPERKVRHEYFSFPKELFPLRKNSWFQEYGLSSTGIIFAHPDIFFSRGVLSSMLLEAWNRNDFFMENGNMKPQPTEVDRMLQIAWLQHVASNTGLLSGEEIRRIQRVEGRMNPMEFMSMKEDIDSFDQLSALTSEWRRNGETIGFFHGSFDPPTVTHVACALDAYEQCDHLLIGFDNDALLKKRKGEERPRFPLATRRRTFGSFWMVDGTVEMRSDDIENEVQYADDYRSLNVDYVFMAKGQEDLEKRMKKVAMGGAQTRFLRVKEGQFSATRLMENAREWGFIP